MDTLIDPILHEFVQVLGVVAAALAVYVLKLIASKIKLTITETEEARIRHYAQQASQYAEEVVETRIKRGIKPLVSSAEEKRQEALAYLQDKAPWLAVAEIEKAVRSELLTLGLGAAAGLQKKAEQIAVGQ